MPSLHRLWRAAPLIAGMLLPAGAIAQSKVAMDPSLAAVLAHTPKSTQFKVGDLVVTAKQDAIVADHLNAAAVLYAASALEEAHFFAVADRLADLFVGGKLPVTRSGKTALANYTRQRPQHLDRAARSRLYSHMLGGSGADANRDFAPLWARFLSAVEQYDRAKSGGVLAKKKAVSPSVVHGAARDLAVNLSNHGYGAPMLSAVMLARHIRELNALLSDPEIQQHFGARDAWSLIEQVAKKELGKTANTTRQRTQAESGAAILQWLGSVTAPMASSGGAPQLAASLAQSRVPAAVRKLGRVVKPKQNPLVQKQTKAPPLRALCFDKKRRLVPCRVVLKQ